VEGSEIAEKNLEILQRTPSDRRERPGGGSLGGVRALSKKREGSSIVNPALLGALQKQGIRVRTGASQGLKHPAGRPLLP